MVQKFPSEGTSSHCIAQTPGAATFFSRLPTGCCCGPHICHDIHSAKQLSHRFPFRNHTRHEPNPALHPQDVQIHRSRPAKGCSGRGLIQRHPVTTEQPMLSSLVRTSRKLSRILLEVAMWRAVVARRNLSSQRCGDKYWNPNVVQQHGRGMTMGPARSLRGPSGLRSPVNRPGHGHSLTSASTQSKVLVTAFFQLRYRRSRSASSILGSQRLSSAQFLTTSSSPLQKPTAIPAA